MEIIRSSLNITYKSQIHSEVVQQAYGFFEQCQNTRVSKITLLIYNDIRRVDVNDLKY
jgi:hypothetical protein